MRLRRKRQPARVTHGDAHAEIGHAIIPSLGYPRPTHAHGNGNGSGAEKLRSIARITRIILKRKMKTVVVPFLTTDFTD